MSISRAEALLRRLPQVTGCRIRADESGQPVAVLVTAAPGSNPQAVLADVITVLGAQAGLDVLDDQVHVVVLPGAGEQPLPEVEPLAGPDLAPETLPELEVVPETVPEFEAVPEAASALAVEPLESEGRLRLVAYGLQVSESRSTAQVELALAALTVRGEAQGHGAGETPELLAQACLDAVERICHGRVTLRLAGFRRVVVGGVELVGVVVQESWGREERLQTGAARISDDVGRAGAYAVLDSLNRRLGRILAAPPLDYQID
ncbi:MAG TPA: hypothetical protein VFE28_08155 [Candidatus Krumholzibacteria bacterium]|nr:hypothetical protein [Candidatus Krumholzibacteria bacterium]